MLDAPSAARIERSLRDAGLPVRFPRVGAEALVARFSKDKKALEGKIRYVLPDRIGHVVMRDDVPLDLPRRVIEGMTDN